MFGIHGFPVLIFSQLIDLSKQDDVAKGYVRVRLFACDAFCITTIVNIITKVPVSLWLRGEHIKNLAHTTKSICMAKRY